MKRIYTKPSRATDSNDVAVSVSSPQSISAQSFFNTALRSQTINQQPLPVCLDPASLLLFTSILNELKTQNDIAKAKMKLEADQKQEELDGDEKAKIEDEKRFEEVKYSLYM